MGQAKLRGTFEQRKAEGMVKRERQRKKEKELLEQLRERQRRVAGTPSGAVVSALMLMTAPLEE